MAERDRWGVRNLLGFRESKGLRIWLIVATFLGVVANFVVLLGCMSPATLPLYLYRVSRPQLAFALSDVAHQNVKELNSTELPDYWYWGMSGVCAVYEVEGTTHCRQSFPLLISLDKLIEFSLGSRFGDEADKNGTQAVLHSWEDASSNFDDRFRSKRSQFIAMSKASAALAILSLIVGVGLLCISVASITERWKTKPKLWVLYLISTFDGFMFLASGILSILAMNSGVRSIILDSMLKAQDPSSFNGPGIYTLFGGAFLKFAAVGLVVAGLFVVILLSVLCACACCASCCEGGGGGSGGGGSYANPYNNAFTEEDWRRVRSRA